MNKTILYLLLLCILPMASLAQCDGWVKINRKGNQATSYQIVPADSSYTLKFAFAQTMNKKGVATIREGYLLRLDRVALPAISSTNTSSTGSLAGQQVTVIGEYALTGEIIDELLSLPLSMVSMEIDYLAQDRATLDMELKPKHAAELKKCLARLEKPLK